MPCFCSMTMSSLSAALPPKLPTITLPSGALSALASVSAAMSANMSMAANLGLSMSAKAKLGLLASINASMKAMGMASFNASAALGLSPLILSLNANMPALPALPMLGSLRSLSAACLLAAVMANLLKGWGINLAMPGAMASLQA